MLYLRGARFIYQWQQARDVQEHQDAPDVEPKDRDPRVRDWVLHLSGVDPGVELYIEVRAEHDHGPVPSIIFIIDIARSNGVLHVVRDGDPSALLLGLKEHVHFHHWHLQWPEKVTYTTINQRKHLQPRLLNRCWAEEEAGRAKDEGPDIKTDRGMNEGATWINEIIT